MLNEGVASKFGVYTLACNQLLAKLGLLHKYTYNEEKLMFDVCINRFDEALKEFFLTSAASNVTDASKRFTTLLKAKASVMLDINSNASKIFQEIASSIDEKSAEWDYKTEMEEFHKRGRELAVSFYYDSTWPVTKDKLTQTCTLYYCFDEFPNSYGKQCAALPEKSHLAPLAYWQKYFNEEQDAYESNKLILRFSFNNNFYSYLSYPFWFLHEYTSHVYSVDNRNELISDGWMLLAISTFLNNQWQVHSSQLGLSVDQVSVSLELNQQLNRNPKRGFTVAYYINKLIEGLENRFKETTYELAAFTPQGKEEKYLQYKLVNSLEYEYSTNPRSLLEKFKNTDNLKDLMTILTPV